MFYTNVVLPADAEADIDGVGGSRLVGVIGKLLFESPSRPRSSQPRLN